MTLDKLVAHLRVQYASGDVLLAADMLSRLGALLDAAGEMVQHARHDEGCSAQFNGRPGRDGALVSPYRCRCGFDVAFAEWSTALDEWLAFVNVNDEAGL